jgi:hypothetical protein
MEDVSEHCAEENVKYADVKKEAVMEIFEGIWHLLVKSKKINILKCGPRFNLGNF